MHAYDLNSREIAKLWQAVFKPQVEIDVEPVVDVPNWNSERFCVPMALRLAQLCHIVYVRDELRRRDLAKSLGMTEIACFAKSELHWSRFEAEGQNGLAILCFRGTSDPRHWVYNLGALLVNWPQGGKVHLGFAGAQEKLQQALEEEFTKRPTEGFLLAGHSLGAAMAQLTASAMQAPQTSIYTFGAPRPGNSAFSDALEAQCKVHRVVNGHDLVTQLPQHWAILDKHAFVHPGVPVRITEEGTMATGKDANLPSPDAMWRHSLLAILEGDRVAEPVPALLDHAPINYVRSLRACLDQGNRS